MSSARSESELADELEEDEWRVASISGVRARRVACRALTFEWPDWLEEKGEVNLATLPRRGGEERAEPPAHVVAVVRVLREARYELARDDGSGGIGRAVREARRLALLLWPRFSACPLSLRAAGAKAGFSSHRSSTIWSSISSRLERMRSCSGSATWANADTSCAEGEPRLSSQLVVDDWNDVLDSREYVDGALELSLNLGAGTGSCCDCCGLGSGLGGAAMTNTSSEIKNVLGIAGTGGASRAVNRELVEARMASIDADVARGDGAASARTPDQEGVLGVLGVLGVEGAEENRSNARRLEVCSPADAASVAVDCEASEALLLLLVATLSGFLGLSESRFSSLPLGFLVSAPPPRGSETVDDE